MQTLRRTTIKFEKFIPKWWAWNQHIQTIIAAKFSKVKKCEIERVEITTPDDDFLEVDVASADTEKPFVALFHGLEGNSERYYICNLMDQLKSAGYSAAALNLRGCGSRINKKKRFYHSGETESYQVFFEWIKETYPGKIIYAIAVSLGGNILVKYLAEMKEESMVQRAVVVSPPYDLKKGSIQLQKGFNKIYEFHFLRTMVEKLEKKRKYFPDLPTFSGNTIYEFDNQITAPLNGFKDADDYYQQCSCKHYFGDIQTPLLLIHSEDDPLCEIEYAPLKTIENNPYIQTLITETGGHVGFLSSPEGWMYRVIMKWLGKDELASY